jgi:hypothetical protein
MSIKLVDAAKFFAEEEHQIDAWEWLQDQVSDQILETFASKYRTKKEPVSKYNNTWDGVLAAGKAAGAKWPEVVAAQWALESGWGEHTSGKNNFFGLKGSGTTVNTQEFINGQWVTIKAGFLDFPDFYTCVCYLVDRWYMDYAQFKGVNRATSRNECARLLVKEGYATDPDYATKLIQIMDRQLNTPGENASSLVKRKILSVPYEYQLDNKSGTGYRECFSSTCAMIAEYYGKVKSDDEYNRIRQKYGDTTSKDAQLAALRSLGLTARFVTNGNAALLENEIRNGRPVAVGWLHQGPVSRPTGGGHWTCCVGFTLDSFVFNDPNGEADMVNGGYVSNAANKGNAVKYTRKNWLRRWECDGPNTGWAILISK